MNKIFKNLFWKFSERMMAQVVTFIVSIILARLLSPDDYGAIAIVNIFITFANVFVLHGFGSALIQKKEVDNIDYSSVLYANLFFSIILYFLLFFASPYIANFYNIDELCPILRVLSIRIPIAAINSVQQAYIAKNMIFKKFFFSTLIGTLTSGIIGCILAYKGYGIWSLVAQYLVNSMLDTLILFITIEWKPIFTFSIQKVKILLSYGWKLLASALLDTGYNQLTSLVIGKRYNTTDLAFFNRGQQYPQLVITNINSSLSSVLFPVISNNQENLMSVKNITRKAICLSAYIICPLMCGLAIIAKPLVILMLTDKWLPCVPYLQIACFSYAFWPIHTANLEALKAIGRSDLFLKLEIYKKIIGLMLLIVSMNFGVMAISLSMIISTLINCFINAYPNTRLLNYTYKEQCQDIIPSIILSLAMCIVIYPIKNITHNLLFTIILQVTIGFLFYVIISKLLKMNSFVYILNLLKRGKK